MKKSFSSQFDGRSVFVTGHTGFKGSWLCLWLHYLGAKVTGYALAPPTNPNNFSLSGIKQLLEKHHEADIRDEKAMHDALLDSDPDIVLHLAAQSMVRESYDIPRETFDVNVMGIASLLDGIRKLEKSCIVIIITSDKCYENREQIWGYRESDPLGDLSPYGGSKGAAEILIRSYRHSYFHPERFSEHGIKLASARTGNVIGGGDWTKDALIVDIVKALSQDKAVKIRNPSSSRPWQHVLQALSGYLTLAEKLLKSDNPSLCSGWNIGPKPGDELPVLDVVKYFIQEWGKGDWKDASTAISPHEANILRLCIDKAIWQLGWKPGWNVFESLKQTALWYKQYFEDPKSLQAFSLYQITEYEKTQLYNKIESPNEPFSQKV